MAQEGHSWAKYNLGWRLCWAGMRKEGTLLPLLRLSSLCQPLGVIFTGDRPVAGSLGPKRPSPPSPSPPTSTRLLPPPGAGCYAVSGTRDFQT